MVCVCVVMYFCINKCLEKKSMVSVWNFMFEYVFVIIMITREI